MRIVEIKKQKKHLCEIVFHTGETLLLDSDYCAEQGFNTDTEVSEADAKKHFSASEYRRALSRGMWYLGQSSFSEKKMREKLKAAGFGFDSADKAVERLKELGLINDSEYALRLAEIYLSECVSKRDALYKMINKGIPRDIAADALDSFECDPVAQIRHIINKKYRSKMSDNLSSQKVFAALQRKGFNYSDIKEAFKQFNEFDYGEENGI